MMVKSPMGKSRQKNISAFPLTLRLPGSHSEVLPQVPDTALKEATETPIEVHYSVIWSEGTIHPCHHRFKTPSACICSSAAAGCPLRETGYQAGDLGAYRSQYVPAHLSHFHAFTDLSRHVWENTQYHILEKACQKTFAPVNAGYNSPAASAVWCSICQAWLCCLTGNWLS